MTTNSFPFNITDIDKEINSFTQSSNEDIITYTFNKEDLGKAHRHENESSHTVEVTPTNDDKLYCNLYLKSPLNNLIKTRKIIKSDIENPRSPTSRITGQIWDWAVYLRNSAHHHAQDKLEELGVIDYYPPTEKMQPADRKNEWYYDTSTDHITLKPKHNQDINRRYHCDRTRIEFMGTNEDHAWICGKVTVTFNHSSKESDKNSSKVYNPTIQYTHYPIIPVNERQNNHDSKDIIREYIYNSDNNNDTLTVDKLKTKTKEALDKLENNAEAQNDEKRQQIIEEAERRWNPEKERYEEAQTNLESWG